MATEDGAVRRMPGERAPAAAEPVAWTSADGPRSDSGRADSGRSDSGRAEPGRADSGRADSDQAGHAGQVAPLADRAAPLPPLTDEEVRVRAETFRRRYRAHAQSPAERRQDAEQQARLAVLIDEHLALGLTRLPGQTLVQLRPIAATGGTSIQIITEDVPYLVDSVRAELARHGHEPAVLLHPELVVARGPDGLLREVDDIDDNAEVPAGAITESWMHAEIGACTADQRAELTDDLQRVLADVHAAVADAPESLALMTSLAATLETEHGYFSGDVSAEAGALLRWLADGNFLVLGHASYTPMELAHPTRRSPAEPGTGVLRTAQPLSPGELLPAFRSGAPIVVMKSPMVSTVYRSARYDCVTVVEPAHGQVQSRLHVFLGLITPGGDAAMARVPVVRRRITEVIERSGVRRGSHTARQMLAALRTVPRDELLEAPASDLLRLAQLVAALAGDGGVGVYDRLHLNLDFVTVLVYFPADRFGPETRRNVAALVSEYWPGTVVGREDRLVELGLARMAFLVAVRPGSAPTPNIAEVEGRIGAMTRRWGDDFADLLTLGMGADGATRLLRRYADAFDEAYKQDFTAADAVRDVRALEALAAAQTASAEPTSPADPSGGEELVFDLYDPGPDDPADRRLKIYRLATPLTLARVLPLLSLLGLQVLDESPYEVSLADGPPTWIYDFGLRFPPGSDVAGANSEHILQALDDLWHARVDEDGFMALVVQAGLTSRQVVILRAYAGYLRQAGTPFSQGYIESTLRENPQIVRLLVELFEDRFDPARQRGELTDGRDEAAIVEQIEQQLGGVPSLDQDRILRSLLNLVQATVRTTAYVPDAPAFAVKIAPRVVRDLPAPKPEHEIWVFSPRVEGVHLRFGAVARGGLRWSDRREDFRTEILGLVRAQMVKNAIIVPGGAKGGFFCKRLPDPAADRDAWQAEGIACYRIYITSLLMLTDNYEAGEDGSRVVVPPEHVVRLDEDDPYLVVAADKGTAAFSDIANEIAVQGGYWLGDAFASGGSVGYDHKAMAITARGAWESARHHFAGLGLDIQAEDFTAVGIGDMSGDVFGNGMLRSAHTRLVAAFDHRHIFLDPDPDAGPSFEERRRLFDLPRSSWADYSTSLISPGGGVFSRSLKAIPLTPQVRQRLSIDDGAESMTPAELIRAILCAPVDLLFNGGIGTYVKAATESHSEAGDRANDAVRVDGAALRARVVVEGGNLGVTQAGRVEYARLGGRINADSIDNSAGVDASDHEVNIKILLDQRVAAGALDRPARNEALLAATDEVAHAVLRDNIEQNILLGVEEQLAPVMRDVMVRLMDGLDQHGLDRALEDLPTDRELLARAATNEGLSRPELAVVSAYIKIALERELIGTDLPEDTWLQRALAGYFPPHVQQVAAGQLSGHPLRREIVTTCVVNDVVNRAGITFAFRAAEEQGTDSAQILRAYTVTKEVFGLEELWDRIEELGRSTAVDAAAAAGAAMGDAAGEVASRDARETAYLEIRRLVDRATRWLLDNRFPITDIAADIDRYRPVVRQLAPQLPSLLRGRQRDDVLRSAAQLGAAGIPEDLALRIASGLTAFTLLDIVEIARESAGAAAHAADPLTVADVYFAVSDRFTVDTLLDRVTALPRDDRWSSLARSALRQDVYGVLGSLTRSVLAATDGALSAAERLTLWESTNAQRMARARAVVQEALRLDQADLATLSVALRALRGVCGSG